MLIQWSQMFTKSHLDYDPIGCLYTISVCHCVDTVGVHSIQVKYLWVLKHFLWDKIQVYFFIFLLNIHATLTFAQINITVHSPILYLLHSSPTVLNIHNIVLLYLIIIMFHPHREADCNESPAQSFVLVVSLGCLFFNWLCPSIYTSFVIFVCYGFLSPAWYFSILLGLLICPEHFV